MPMDIPLDDFDSPKDVRKPSGGRPAPGIYHAQIVETEEKEGLANLKFEVLSPGENCGKNFYCTAWYHSSDGDENKNRTCLKNLMRLVLETRVLSDADFAAMRAAGQPFSFDPVSLMGAQAIVEVKARKYKDKKTGEDREGVEAAIWDVHDVSQVNDKFPGVVLNDEVAALIGVTRTTPFANPAPSKAQTAAAAKPKPASSVAAKPANAGKPTQQAAAKPQPAAVAGTGNGKYDDI